MKPINGHRIDIKTRNQGTKLGMVVMYRSVDGNDPWGAIHRDEVPGWIKNDPDMVGRMLSGLEAHNEDEGGYYYRAVHAKVAESAHTFIATGGKVH